MAKVAGLKSLAEVERITGVHRVTLERWAIKKPDLLKVVISGCVESIKLSEVES